MGIKLLLAVVTLVIGLSVPSISEPIVVRPVENCEGNNTFNKACELEGVDGFCNYDCEMTEQCELECLPVLEYLCNAIGFVEDLPENNSTATMVLDANNLPQRCSDFNACPEEEGFMTLCMKLSDGYGGELIDGYCCKKQN